MIVQAGVLIYDEDGTYICRLAKNVQTGDPILVEQFDDWQIEKPKYGTQVHPAIAKTMERLFSFKPAQ